MFETFRYALIVVDLEGLIVMANERAAKMSLTYRLRHSYPAGQISRI